MNKEMTYELAKQLKDAGFPQVKKKGYWIGNPAEYWPDGTVKHVEYYAPTLEELIEACGDIEIGIHKLRSNYLSSKADRDSRNIRYFGGYEVSVHEDGDEEYQWLWAKTPSEAVARLYLALHDKNQK